MASTIRLVDGLRAEAQAYASSVGLSLNGLCAVALRDYLDARKPGARAGVSQGSAKPAETATETRPAAPAPAVPATVGGRGGAMRAEPVLAAPLVPMVPKVPQGHPCPCGSGLKYKRCHGRA
jgi:hypothetical protein